MSPGILMVVSPQSIFHYDKYTTDITKQILKEAESISDKNIVENVKSQKIISDKTKVFIVSGIVYIPMDANKGWQLTLAQEMKSAGYAIDFNILF